jgi:uracil-DNA glycosylase
MRKQEIKYSPIIETIKKTDNLVFKYLSENFNFDEFPEDRHECLQYVKSLMAECQNCALAETRNSVVMPDGTVNAKIMVIGEGPGSMEDAAALPFVGPNELKASHCNTCKQLPNCYSHKILLAPDGWNKKNKPIVCKPNYDKKLQLPQTFYLRSAGAIVDGILYKTFGSTYPRQNWIDFHNRTKDLKIPYDSIWYVTNTVACRSYNTLTNKDESPSNLFMSKCKPWFVLQWAIIQPTIIVCFGKPALELICGGKSKAAEVVYGDIFESKYGPAIAQPHPASIMREKQKEAQALSYAKISESFKKAVKFVEDTYKLNG